MERKPRLQRQRVQCTFGVTGPKCTFHSRSARTVWAKAEWHKNRWEVGAVSGACGQMLTHHQDSFGIFELCFFLFYIHFLDVCVWCFSIVLVNLQGCPPCLVQLTCLTCKMMKTLVWAILFLGFLTPGSFLQKSAKFFFRRRHQRKDPGMSQSHNDLVYLESAAAVERARRTATFNRLLHRKSKSKANGSASTEEPHVWTLPFPSPVPARVWHHCPLQICTSAHFGVVWAASSALTFRGGCTCLCTYGWKYCFFFF